MEQQWICPVCSKRISVEDSLVFTGDRIAHLYCRRPQALSPEERALLDNVRAHLYGCAMRPPEVRRRAQAARETSRALVKRGRELGDRADVLMREAEVALNELRETMRGLGKRSA